jgi:hypothetical protein
MTTHVPLWTVYDEVDNTNPKPSRAQDLRGMLALVAEVAGAGIDPPPGWQPFVDRVRELQDLVSGTRHPMLDRLVAAGRDPSVDIADAWDRARSEAIPANVTDLLLTVYAAWQVQLADLWRPGAEKAYNRIARQFDDTAKAFTSCAQTINPNTDPAEVLKASPQEQQSWRDAEVHAATLDRLLLPLSASAELWRDPGAPAGYGNSRDPFLLPLAVEAYGCFRRSIWHSWLDEDTPPPPGGLTLEMMEPKPPPPAVRCGRWTRLLACGATIRAHSNPVGMELFSPLAKFGLRVERTPGLDATNPGRQKLHRYDPEGTVDEIPSDRWAKIRQFKRRIRQEQERQDDDIMDTVLDDDKEPS